MRVLANQKKPDPKKNAIENYIDHAQYVFRKYKELEKELRSAKSMDKASDLMYNTAIKRLNFFQPLRDGHDYTDEVLGVLSTPVVLLASLTFLMKSIYHKLSAVFINGNSRSDNDESIENLYNACLGLIVGICNYLISAPSLITRPIATAIYGFAKQDTNRFYVEDSIEGKLSH